MPLFAVWFRFGTMAWANEFAATTDSQRWLATFTLLPGGRSLETFDMFVNSRQCRTMLRLEPTHPLSLREIK
eukprot:5398457-Prymnesium_polylepis.1